MAMPFEVVADPTAPLLRVRIRGFWDLAVVDAYRAEVARAAQALYDRGITREQMNVLLDARDFPVQSQEVVAAYQARFNGPDMAVRRVATLATNTLFRLQARRIGVEEQRVFDEQGAALAWLLTPDQPA